MITHTRKKRGISLDEHIMNCAEKLYIKTGGEKITMDEISHHANIGRATLYRHFKSRDELIFSILEREAKNIATRIQQQIKDIENPGEYIIEGMVQAVTAVSNSKLFKPNDSTIMRRLFFKSEKLKKIGLELIIPVLEKAQSSNHFNRNISLDIIMEWIFRTLISLITIPSPNTKTEDDMRTLLKSTMLPVLLQ